MVHTHFLQWKRSYIKKFEKLGYISNNQYIAIFAVSKNLLITNSYDLKIDVNMELCICRTNRALRGYPLSMYAKFSKKLSFLTPWYVCVSGGRNVSFSENFAYIINGWPLSYLVGSRNRTSYQRKSVLEDFVSKSLFQILKTVTFVKGNVQFLFLCNPKRIKLFLNQHFT